MRLLKTLFSFIVLTLLAAALAGIVAAVTWLYVGATLPVPINSAMDVELQLRKNIESARQAAQGHKHHKEQVSTDWPRPDLERLPKLLVGIAVMEDGCADYLKTPQEVGAEWAKRVAWSLMGKGLPGDGACELSYAHSLARRMDAKTTLEVAVAADRIHRYLTKEELLAYFIESTEYEGGVVGPEAAAPVLLTKKLKELNLAETVEVALALPPDNFWDEVSTCQNAALIKQTRDVVLKRMGSEGLISPELAASTAGQPIRCTSVKKWK